MALPPRIPGRPGTPPPVEDSLAAKRAGEVLADETSKVEEELEALKARYEMYFLGIEKREPSRERGEMKRRVERLKDSFTKNTGLRFRLQTLHARFLSYERLWMRSAREKEEGTYRKDLLRARMRSKDAKEPRETTPAAGTPAPAEAAAAKPAAAGARPPAPRAAAASAGPATFSGTSEPQLRALYDAYVAAKRQCKEDVSRLSYESLAKSVHKQVPELMAKFKARSVDFRVEVKDGKAVLRAIPKV